MTGRVYDRAAWRRARHPTGSCVWCGRPAEVWDHLIPIAEGGAPFDRANLVLACHACNRRRGLETARRRAIGNHSRRW